MRYCDNCGNIAGERKKFRDPRRDADDHDAYVERYFCSVECEEEIVDKLEHMARIARLVN